MSAPDLPTSPQDPQYEAFYGLTEQPFAISTDPKFLFLSASHQRAYQELFTGLQRHEGLLLLTGEAGTGKTTLCRAVIDALGERTFSAILLNPYMSGAELLKVVLKEFGLVTREELRRGALARAEPPQLLDAIEGFLLSVRSVESRAVIVVDEAQSLSPIVLDQVRLLTALERQGKPLLQIIIGGQPKLIETLKKDAMYALSERITRRVHLAPLLADEIQAYVSHRLSVAGGAEAVTFLPEATALIAELSRGLPRRVNLLCDRALQEGRVEQSRRITADMVRRAARSLAGTAPQASEGPGDSIADGVPDIARTPVSTIVQSAAATASPPDPTDAAVAPDEDLDGWDTVTPREGQPAIEPEPWTDAEPTPAAPEPEPEPWDDAPRDSAEESAASHASDDALVQLRSELAEHATSADSSLSFGQEEPAPRRTWLKMLIGVALLLAALAYGYFAMTAVSADTNTPEAPVPATSPAPAALTEPRPVPDQATIDADLEQFRLLLLLNAAGGGVGGG